MNQIKQKAAAWNRSLDQIWADTGQETQRKPHKGSRKQRSRAFFKRHCWEFLFLLVLGCVMFGLSWILPFNGGPDEAARYLVPKYIYNHGTIPVGWDPEILDEIWGISYAFHPILPYILGGYLMRFVGLFSTSEQALLMAARSANILIGLVFYWTVIQIAKELFQRKLFRIYFLALVCMLPQLMYLFLYINTDGIAICSSGIIIYYWIDGIKNRWDRRSCTGLSIGLAVCALSYFNAYGYGLMSVFLLIATMLVLFQKKLGFKRTLICILKRGLYISVLVFILSGWWFVRSAILYEGDFLGMTAADRCAEENGREEFRPSVKKSIQEEGYTLQQMLGSDEENGELAWARYTYYSSIGVFGFMDRYIGLDLYGVHKRLILLGILGIGLGVLWAVIAYVCRSIQAAAAKKGRKRKGLPRAAIPDYSLGEEKVGLVNFCILQFSLVCCIIIPILLSIYYSYMSDFQAQGRYVMPLILPLLYLTTKGTEQFMTLLFKPWMGYLLMIPLFYAVLHVFLGAFVSTYIPAYVESLSAWGQIRLPWFSNVKVINMLISCLIPG